MKQPKKGTPGNLQKFLELRRQGLSNKAISKALEVSIQSLSEWSGNLPQIQAEKAVKAMQKRLLTITPTATPREISQMQDAISKAQKMACSNIQ